VISEEKMSRSERREVRRGDRRAGRGGRDKVEKKRSNLLLNLQHFVEKRNQMSDTHFLVVTLSRSVERSEIRNA
jgi:hypothetical protein